MQKSYLNSDHELMMALTLEKKFKYPLISNETPIDDALCLIVA